MFSCFFYVGLGWFVFCSLIKVLKQFETKTNAANPYGGEAKLFSLPPVDIVHRPASTKCSFKTGKWCRVNRMGVKVQPGQGQVRTQQTVSQLSKALLFI